MKMSSLPKRWLALFLLISAAISTNASTTVAVIELGKGGAVRQSSSSGTTASVAGIRSFWANLHNLTPRRYQQRQEPGMSLVPDLFNKVEGGFVIGLMGRGIDISSMNIVSSLLDSSSELANVVGRFDLEGEQARPLLSKKTSVIEDVVKFGDALRSNAEKMFSNKPKKFEAVAFGMPDEDTTSLEAVDKEIENIIASLKTVADSKGSSIVVHLVVEEFPPSARETRKLDEDDEDNGNGNSLYYGFGYYDENGEYYTPYRTIFQIQYFNCVAWTSVGLFLIVFYSIYTTLYMPLMPDTLLFGESAKMVTD